MTEPSSPKPTGGNLNSSSSSSSSTKMNGEIGSGSGPKFPNPRETVNPDSATLKDQWRFAIRQYSKWYSHAWGTAILAGVSFFALGWFIKGSNPLDSFKKLDKNNDHDKDGVSPAAEVHQSG